MKRPPFIPLLACFGLLSGLTARADTLDEWYKLLPKNTVGLLAVKDTPELLADWEKSSFTKLMADPEFQKWTAPMRENGETIWDKDLKENTGEGLYENLQRVRGAALMAVVADGPADFEGDGAPIVILMETGDQQAKLEELMNKENERSLEADKDLKASVKDIAGVDVHVLAVSDAEDAAWKKAHAFVNGVLVMAGRPAVMEHFIMALKTGNAEPSVTVTSHLGRLEQLTGGPTDIIFYMNGEILVQWGLEAAKKAAAENPQASAMPVVPEQIMAALGLDELQSVGLMLDLTDSESRFEFALLHPEKPTGLVSLMRGTGGEVRFPSFIPADVLSANVMRYSMLELWDKVLVIVNKFGPMAAMATMQLGGVETQAGVNLRNDLFASLDDEYIEVTDGALDQPSQVLAFRVKDHQRLAGAIDGVKRFAGAGFAAFEESEYLGYQISMAKAQNAEAGAAALAFCLTEDYFFFSTGPQTLLKKILARKKEPTGPSVWENDRVQDLLARLPPGYIGAGVADGGKLVKAAVDAMTLVQGQAAKTSKKKGSSTKAKKGKGPKSAAAEEEPAAETETWFDAKAVPSDAMWKRYFGTSVSGYYTPADAIYNRALTTPVEAR